jgi:lipoic acid synthetase
VPLPAWLRKSETHFAALHEIKRDLRSLGLHTVCESARCPNIHECFDRGTATFLILGNVCTRRCGFCAVPCGEPAAPDAQEPEALARMARRLRLRHVVLTSVTRDDLPDGGARHFALTVEAVRGTLPKATIEVLTPDFQGDPEAIQKVLESGPRVFNHNLETVERLYPLVRPQADYLRSLNVLRMARSFSSKVVTKSGLMLGLGEERREVERLLADLREAGVDVVTIGQYLPPSRGHLPMVSYVPPEEFDAWRTYALALGFREVSSAPLVRSSYMAETVLREATC